MSKRRRKTSRTRRIDGAEVQRRQAAAASAAFWHGTAEAAMPSEQPRQSEQPENAEQSEEPGQPEQSEKPGQPGQPGQLTQSAAVSDFTDDGLQASSGAVSAFVTRQQLGTFTRQITVTDDPTSTVRSLGKPPLAVREEAAMLYFEAVYKRATAMAGALAAAGGLLASDDEEPTTY